MNYENAQKLLAQYNQEHILEFYNELDEISQQNLLSQIERIDFSILDALNENDECKKGKISPISAVTSTDIKENGELYSEIGLSAIKQGKVAAVLLAGGQGTRLGFDKPKGMFNIGVNKDLYIFECLVNNLLEVVNLAGSWIPFVVMTSEKNNDDTINFFVENNYFGYNSEYVSFFIQDMAPSVDFNGKIYMEDKGKISSSPNGNGGWFSSLIRSGIFNKLRKDGVEWLNVFAVDNVLQRIADPSFIGAVINSGYDSGSKVVSKASPEENVGVMCLEDDKSSIIEYYELTDDMRYELLDNGDLAYKYGVILNYLFRMDCLVEINNEKMPIHIVKKKIPYMNEKLEFVTPDKINGYKFETLILDMIKLNKNCLPYEVERNREFAPVKNKEGVDSVDTARALLEENGVEL